MNRSPLQPHDCSKCLKVGVTTKSGRSRNRTATAQEPDPVARTVMPPVEQVQGLAGAPAGQGPDSGVQVPTVSMAVTSGTLSGGIEMSSTGEYAHPMLQFRVQTAPTATVAATESVSRIASRRMVMRSMSNKDAARR